MKGSLIYITVQYKYYINQEKFHNLVKKIKKIAVNFWLSPPSPLLFLDPRLWESDTNFPKACKAFYIILSRCKHVRTQIIFWVEKKPSMSYKVCYRTSRECWKCKRKQGNDELLLMSLEKSIILCLFSKRNIMYFDFFQISKILN